MCSFGCEFDCINVNVVMYFIYFTFFIDIMSESGRVYALF